VDSLPAYVQDLKDEIDNNEQFQNLNEDYDLTGKLDDLAQKLGNKLGDAAGTLVDIGAGVVTSLFAGVTILVLSMFMVARGMIWRDAFLRLRPPAEAEAWRRALDRIADAVSSYVAGALFQATVAGIAAFLMLVILGIPSIVIIAALVGGTLLGVIGALLAIPSAATIQIALREYLQYKGMLPRPVSTDEAIPAA
jgi:predicted PurR-regulated permease PerM